MDVFKDNVPETTLDGGITDSATSLDVTSATGYPSVPFPLCLDVESDDYEWVRVTAVSTNTFTVERGAYGTTAVSHADAVKVRHGVPAEMVGLGFGWDMPYVVGEHAAHLVTNIRTKPFEPFVTEHTPHVIPRPMTIALAMYVTSAGTANGSNTVDLALYRVDETVLTRVFSTTLPQTAFESTGVVETAATYDVEQPGFYFASVGNSTDFTSRPTVVGMTQTIPSLFSGERPRNGVRSASVPPGATIAISALSASFRGELTFIVPQ